MRDVTCSTMVGETRCGHPAVNWDEKGFGFCEAHSRGSGRLIRNIRNRDAHSTNRGLSLNKYFRSDDMKNAKDGKDFVRRYVRMPCQNCGHLAAYHERRRVKNDELFGEREVDVRLGCMVVGCVCKSFEEKVD